MFFSSIQVKKSTLAKKFGVSIIFSYESADYFVWESHFFLHFKQTCKKKVVQFNEYKAAFYTL